MVCPKCGGSITVDLGSLSITCPHCYYRFNIDRIRTGKELERLKKIEKEQQKGL